MIQAKGFEKSSQRQGFTLVELLVVIGIIAMLIAMLLPSLNKARAQAKKVQCAANLKDLGNALLIYANDSRGWLVPVGEWDEVQGHFTSLGTNVAPAFRWPTVVYKVSAPLPADLVAYEQQYEAAGRPYDPGVFPVEPFTPKVMRCPADVDDPIEAHSYVINKHLAKRPAQNEIKRYGSKMGSGLTASQVPLVGEKVSTARDYYLEKEHYNDPFSVSEFLSLIEPYRHGTVYGSNYLYMDIHVGSALPTEAAGAIDPWDVPSGNTTP